MTNFLFYNPGMLGDIIYSLPFCLSMVGTYQQEALEQNKFDLMLDTLIHHDQHDNNNNFECLCMARDLLVTQPYINSIVCEPRIDFGKYHAFDLGAIRHGKIDMHRGDIVYKYRHLNPLPNFYNAEDPWLILPTTVKDYNYFKDKIVIFRSARYHNNIDYTWLKPEYIDNMVFIGLESEYKDFTNTFKLNLTYIQPTSFIEVAHILKNCRFCIGNQTFYFALAEALKVPRLLEQCHDTPDVIPKGAWAMEFVDNDTFHQDFVYFNRHL